MILIPDTKGFEKWSSSEVPLRMSFRFFDILNADEILQNATIKPVVSEVGPYVFHEIRLRDQHHYLNDFKTLRFNETKSFVFEPNLSNGTLGDSITTVNMPLLVSHKYQIDYESMMFNCVCFSFLPTFWTRIQKRSLRRQSILWDYIWMD